jgi:toxin co-regulated pilus biosynthesis protein B
VHKFSRGFTLLEMLVVLVIIGLTMAFTINIKQKNIEEIKQRQTAKLITREIHGLVEFIQQGQVSVIENGKGNNFKINPLYDLKLTGARKAVYSRRVTNYKMAEVIRSTRFFEWYGPMSQRSYFVSNRCGPETLNKVYHFEKEFLPCASPSQLAKEVLNIVRVDLVGDPKRQDVDRADFIISYSPLTPRTEDKLRFDSYLQPFNKAFEDMGLSYAHAHIVVRPPGSNANSAWQLLMTGSESQRVPVNFGEMSRYIATAGSNLKQQFGIRISVSTKNAQKTQLAGSVGAGKLCWDASKSNTTLCLSSEAGQGYNHAENNVLVLEANNADGSKTVGTLLTNVILESPGRYTDSPPELTTIPLISYASFTNKLNTWPRPVYGRPDLTLESGARYDKEHEGSLLDEGGRISLPVQNCPMAPDNRQLHPRIAVAISSFASDVSYNMKRNVGVYLYDYSNPASTRSISPSEWESRFSKIELQVNRYDKIWVVTSTISAYNYAYEKTFSYRNPSSISVVVTRWCSTVEVDYSRVPFKGTYR